MNTPLTKTSRFGTIIFDLDDTLLYHSVNSVWKSNRAALELLVSESWTLDELENNLRRVYRSTTSGKGNIVSKVAQFQILLERMELEFSADELFERYIKEYLSLVSLFPDALATLDWLDRNSVPMAIATNSPADIAAAVFEHFDLNPYFDYKVAASQVGAPKPSETFSDFLNQKIDQRPVLFVGDGNEDGLTANMIDAKFAYVNRREEFLSCKPNYFIDHLSELIAIIEPKKASQ